MTLLPNVPITDNNIESPVDLLPDLELRRKALYGGEFTADYVFDIVVEGRLRVWSEDEIDADTFASGPAPGEVSDYEIDLVSGRKGSLRVKPTGAENAFVWRLLLPTFVKEEAGVIEDGWEAQQNLLRLPWVKSVVADGMQVEFADPECHFRGAHARVFASCIGDRITPADIKVHCFDDVLVGVSFTPQFDTEDEVAAAEKMVQRHLNCSDIRLQAPGAWYADERGNRRMWFDVAFASTAKPKADWRVAMADAGAIPAAVLEQKEVAA